MAGCLPDGTVLSIDLGGFDVGTLTVTNCEVAGSIPVPFQVGLNSFLIIRDGATFLVVKNWQ